MTFERHTSKELTKIFSEKPYQGASPEKAKIIFLSSDANYSPEISNHHFFRYILEYQKDGVAFWEKYGVHHPFLLDDYPFNKAKAGRPFHNNFRKIGLDSRFARYISFVELLDIPTIGNKSENRELFYTLGSSEHLSRLDRLVRVPGDRLIFVSRGVLRDMIRFRKQFGGFAWLPGSLQNTPFSYKWLGNEVRETYHFSSSHIHAQLPDIKRMVVEWLAVMRR